MDNLTNQKSEIIYEKYLVIIVMVSVSVALTAAGGVYWRQQRISQHQLSGLRNQLSESEALRLKVENEKFELERQICTSNKGTWENNTCVAPQYNLRLVAPKGENGFVLERILIFNGNIRD